MALLEAGRVGADVTHTIVEGQGGGSLSQPPPELARMDGSEDEDVVLPRVRKVFYSITYATKGSSLAVLWMEIAISWRKNL